MSKDAPPLSVDPRQFRDVLGHFPTGVVVVTAMGTDGQPLGMAVGSFTSVSLDPPLVAFLPDKGSTTFPRIQAAGRFCVNVLSSSQESVCRAFAMRGGDKFSSISWTPAPSGSPVLDGVVAWIDCELEEIHDAGDHFIAVGRVANLTVENPVTPLLFFQGGYGTFALNSLVMGAREGWHDQILIADKARAEMEELARSTRVSVRAYGVRGSNLVVVASASPQGGPSPSVVGLRLPFQPPFGRPFAAWSDDEVFEAWCSRSAQPLSSEARDTIRRDLRAAGANGWVATYRYEGMDEVWSLAEKIAEVGETPALSRQLGAKVNELHPVEPDRSGVPDGRTIQGFSAPIFDAAGHVALVLSVFDIPPETDAAALQNVLDALVSASRRISSSLTSTIDAASPSWITTAVS